MLVTVAQLETHLDADLTDANATQAITLASEAVRQYCGRPFAATTAATYTTYSPGHAIILPHTGVTVTEVKINDVVFEDESYRVDSAAGVVYRLDAGWWFGTIEVTYNHGSATVPDPVKLATLQIAAKVLTNPTVLESDSIEGYDARYGPLVGDAERLLLSSYATPVVA